MKKLHRFFTSMLAASLYLCAANSYASATISVSEKNGLPLIHIGGAPALSSSYIFWGENWDWAGQKIDFRIRAPYKYEASGENKKLDFNLHTGIEKTGDSQLSWSFEFNANNLKTNVRGGGIEFKFDLEGSGFQFGDPELLPDNRGWHWEDQQGRTIEVRFNPTLASVKFTRGGKDTIRAFFFENEIPKGMSHFTMIIKSRGNAVILPTLGERFGMQDTGNWPKDIIDWKTFPIDLSHLNDSESPAGKHGFLEAHGDELVFQDGTTAQFWGANITADTLFETSKTNIEIQAKRLSAMGFNLVRLHHHDSAWVNPNIFGPRDPKDTQHLNEVSLDKLDFWIASLKNQGIYIWLDLHVQRYLKAGDNISYFDEIDKKQKRKKRREYGGVDLKGYNYVNPTIKDAMKRFNRSYVTHVNPYTELAYKDDPAIMAMLITNENDITGHYGNSLLKNKKVPEHNKLYRNEVEAFAKKHDLPVKKTGLSWVFGPSKLFLNDLEHRFNEELIAELRKTGVKVPIVTTNTWGKNPLASLPALTNGDIIDVHSYGRVLEIERNPVTSEGMTDWMAAAQVMDKPVSVTEWNVGRFPVLDGHTNSLLVASRASHQGWDALMHYAYAQNNMDKVGRPSSWHAHNDPARLATLPAAALLYRQGHVKGATTTYYLAPGSKLFNEKINPTTSAAIRTSSKIGKLVIAMPETKSLPWLVPSKQPSESILIEDYRQSFIGPASSSVTTDTGELHHDWEQGVYTINTGLSQVAMGWIGNKDINLANTEFRITTRNATVAVQSLDGNEIGQSRDILISLSTNSIPYKDLKNRKKLPFHSEPLKGRLSVTAAKGLRLAYIDNQGKKKSIPVSYEGNQYIIDLDNLPLVHWLSLSE